MSRLLSLSKSIAYRLGGVLVLGDDVFLIRARLAHGGQCFAKPAPVAAIGPNIYHVPFSVFFIIAGPLKTLYKITVWTN